MPNQLAIPEVGQAVRVRNRLATVRAVEPYDTRTAQGRLNIVDVEYLDDFRLPRSRATALGSGIHGDGARQDLAAQGGREPARQPSSSSSLYQCPPLDTPEPAAGRRRHRERATAWSLELGNSGSSVPIGAGHSSLVHAPCQPTAGGWRGPGQDDPVRLGAGRTPPATTYPPHPSHLPGHAPTAVAVRASAEVQSRFQRSSTPIPPSSFAVTWASTRTRGRLFPGSSRRWTTCECPTSCSNSFRHPVSVPMPKPMAARWPTPRGTC